MTNVVLLALALLALRSALRSAFLALSSALLAIRSALSLAIRLAFRFTIF